MLYSTHLTFHPGEDRLASVHVPVDLRTPGTHSTLRDSASTLSATHLPARNGAPVTRYHRSRDPQSTAGHGLWGVPPTPRHWPRPPVLAAHQTCPRSSPLRISRPGGSVVRPATCGPADRWRSTVAARTEAHSTLPGVLGVTACVALPRAPFVVASSFCSTASPQSHAP